MSEAGKRLISGATEALAVARGEEPAALITINGHRYVPAAEITRLQKELETVREALKPFVQYAPEQCFVGSGRFTPIQTIEAGGGWFGAEDFRRARDVYRALKDKEVAG